MEKHLVIYEKGTIEDPLTDFFAAKLSSLELWREIYCLHHGVNYDAIQIEEPSDTCAPISTILDKMKALVYPYILNKK